MVRGRRFAGDAATGRSRTRHWTVETRHPWGRGGRWEHPFALSTDPWYIAAAIDGLEVEMTEPVEGRQRQILEFLRTHARQHSYPPTVREIGHAVGLSSSSTVQNHLNALETKGLIRRDPTKSRTVEVVGAETVLTQPVASTVLRLPL